jgi:hypothetical protein
MDSQNQSNKKLPSIRTYAKDLENTRKVKNLPTNTTISEATPLPASIVATEKKKEPKIIATPIPKPKFFARPESTKETPTLKPIPAKKTPPKIPTFTAPDSNTFIVDNEDAAAATIITDTKRDRFKLLPSIFTSIRQWFADQKKARAVKNAPKYTVPETTHRKGVIQKATSTTGKSATADFASIQERIKQRKAHIQKPEPSTTWSANTEPVFLLLPGEVTKPVTNVQFVSRKSFRTAPARPTPSLEPVISPIEESDTPLVPITETITEVSTPEVERLTTEEVGSITESAEPSAEELIYTNENSPKHRFLSINTNLLALGISGAALILVVVTTFGYVVMNNKSTLTTTTIITPAPLLQTSSFTPIADTNLTSEAIITKLATLMAETATVSEFVFTDTIGVAYTPQEIITTLDIAPEQNFTQAVHALHFGFVANTEPYLLLEVTDEIAARGGLLIWEESLYQDFTTIFSKEAETLGERVKFVDGTFAGSDVRILKNAAGSEIAIYGMLGNKVLITTNSRTFSDVANLIK